MILYNDNDKFCCQWLRKLVDAGHLPAGRVECEDIRKLDASTLPETCHFFAGIGGWPLALKLAGWTEPVWSASCPCQPLSCAGKRKGHADERHLWPTLYALIAKCGPPTVFGEQVSGKDGREWLAGVRADLEGIGYAFGTICLSGYCVGAPHERARAFWVANTTGYGRQRLQRCTAAQVQENRASEALDTWHGTGNPFEHWKKLMAESRVCKMDDGVSSGVEVRPALRAYGNSIIPQVAVEFIKAVMET